MKKIQVRLPEKIHEKVKELAREDGMSINSFIVASVSNEVIRQETRDFFRNAAASFDNQLFVDALAAIPDVPAPDMK
jgi:membrane protease subunit (stomatin/prohibitin family)